MAVVAGHLLLPSHLSQLLQVPLVVLAPQLHLQVLLLPPATIPPTSAQIQPRFALLSIPTNDSTRRYKRQIAGGKWPTIRLVHLGWSETARDISSP